MSTSTAITTSASPAVPACPECQCKLTVKKGKRRNRFQTLQLYQCTECLHRFSAGAGKNRSYPFKVILDALSTFNAGHSLTETQRIIRQRHHFDIPQRTISAWLKTHRKLATYARLRSDGRQLFNPKVVVRSWTFHHQQVYRFHIHQAKLALLLKDRAHHTFATLNQYLASITRDFPHHIFQSTEHRSSKFPAQLHPPITRKENHATQLAALALPTSPNNKKRHETLQRFMLLNDSTTVAVEIPIYLTRSDIAYYRACGFDLNFQSEVITGHIDFLQIRNGHLHILDYKPNAIKETHAHVQLTIYALALARRAKLPLKAFKCAWFDEKDYFEFFPLQAVYRSKEPATS